MMKTFSLSRQELYEQVWSKPMVTLAKEYSLSDNGLRKICKKNDIPIPPMGYWQKIQYGKKVSKIALPKKSNEEAIKINIEEVKNSQQSNPIRNSVSESIKSNKSLILKVPERLNNPDDIIIKTQVNLKDRQTKDSYSPIKGTIQTDRGFPSIIVTPKNISRSLRILDILIKNFRILNYKIVLKDEGLTIIAYDDDEIKVYIREKCNSVKIKSDYSWENRELIPNGKLSLKVTRFGTYEFADTDKTTLEEQIEKILIKIDGDFQEMHERRRLRQIEQQRQDDLKKIEEDKQKLKDNELSKFIEFYNNAHRWKKFTILKEYFNFLNEQDDKSSDVKEWLSWAKSKLDWYNPMLDTHDELLADVDKDSLTFKKKQGNNYHF